MIFSFFIKVNGIASLKCASSNFSCLYIGLEGAILTAMKLYKADIQNEAHRIIYSRLYGKFKELLDNKNRLIDESEALYEDAFQKYKDS